MMLIEENLKAKAIGFSKDGPGFLQVSQGESIHAFCHTIHSLKAFQQNNDIICCMNIYQKLDLHYQEKGLTDNERLPSWIHTVDLINGTIMLSGIPKKKDIGSIFIKLFDQDIYILRSYEIQVLQKLTNEPLYLRKQESKLDDNNSINYFIPIILQDKSMLKSQKHSAFAPVKDETLLNDIVLNQEQQNQEQIRQNDYDFEQQNQTDNQILDSFIRPCQVFQERAQEKPSQFDETINMNNESFVNISNNNLKQNNNFNNFQQEDRSYQLGSFSNQQAIEKYDN